MNAAETSQIMARLPKGDLTQILDGRDPLVLAPHPDNESLGCGALLAAHAAAGGNPFVLIITDGTGSHPRSQAYPPERLRAIREDEAAAALTALGVDPSRLGFLRLPDTAAPWKGPAFQTAVTAICDALDRSGCSLLLAPWRHDPHCDHVAVHLMAQAAALQSGLPHLAYPVWGLTQPDEQDLDGPAPQGWRFPATAWLDRKRAAINAHQSQTGKLIQDDPTGFTLPATLLHRMLGPYETYLSAP